MAARRLLGVVSASGEHDTRVIAIGRKRPDTLAGSDAGVIVVGFGSDRAYGDGRDRVRGCELSLVGVGR